MKKLFLISAILPLVLLNSCSDENIISYEEKSETEIMAKKLHEMLDGKNFGVVSVYVYNAQENS